MLVPSAAQSSLKPDRHVPATAPRWRATRLCAPLCQKPDDARRGPPVAGTGPIHACFIFVAYNGAMTIPLILKYAAIGLAICIGPLFVVGGLGISDNPVGLGILMVVGVPIVLLASACAITFRIIQIWNGRA